MSRVFKGFLLIFLIGVFASIFSAREREQKRAEEARVANEKEAQRFAALTPEQRAKELAQKERDRLAAEAQAAAKAKQDAIDELAKGIAAAGARTLMSAMKDPESFDLKEVLYMEGGGICYTYRARNSFNAMLQANAVIDSQAKDPKILTSDRDGNRFVSVWNKKCAQKSGKDWTDIVKLVIGRM